MFARIGIARSCGHLCLTWGTTILFFHCSYTILHSHHWCSRICLFVCLWLVAILMVVKWVSLCGFDLHFCIGSLMLTLHVLTGHLCILLEETFIQVLCPFLNQVVAELWHFCMCCGFSIFYDLQIIFSYSVVCLFYSLDCILWCKEALNLM